MLDPKLRDPHVSMNAELTSHREGEEKTRRANTKGNSPFQRVRAQGFTEVGTGHLQKKCLAGERSRSKECYPTRSRSELHKHNNKAACAILLRVVIILVKTFYL